MNTLQAGFSRVNVTPMMGIPMRGYFKERYADSYDPYSMLPDPYLNVSQTPNFITEHPERIVEWIERYEVNKANCVEALKALKTVDNYFLHKLEAQFEQNN